MNFTKDTIEKTVGILIDESKSYRKRLKRPGVKRHSMTFKLYDTNGCSIGIFPAFPIVNLTREMYRIKSGSVESNRYQHRS